MKPDALTISVLFGKESTKNPDLFDMIEDERVRLKVFLFSFPFLFEIHNSFACHFHFHFHSLFIFDFPSHLSSPFTRFPSPSPFLSIDSNLQLKLSPKIKLFPVFLMLFLPSSLLLSPLLHPILCTLWVVWRILLTVMLCISRFLFCFIQLYYTLIDYLFFLPSLETSPLGRFHYPRNDQT